MAKKYSDVKSHERCPCCSMWTDQHRQTYMVKLTVAFRKYANTPKNNLPNI